MFGGRFLSVTFMGVSADYPKALKVTIVQITGKSSTMTVMFLVPAFWI